MAVKKEKYDPSKIDIIKSYLTDQQNDGCPRPFEIFVDELKVVSRTEDVAKFDNYEKYMRPDTVYVLVKLYHNSSPNNDQYYYYLREEATAPDGLSGVERIVNQRLEERDREYQINRLTEDLEKARQDLTEAEEYAEMLEEQIEQLKNDKGYLGKINLGEIAANTLTVLARNNPQWMNRSPLGKALSGLIPPDEPAPDNGPDAEAEFKKKTNSGTAVTEDEKVIIEIVKNLSASMNEDQLRQVALILQKFSNEPQQIQTVAELLSLEQ